MKIEETPKRKKRCWLNSDEQEQLIEYFDDEPIKQLAVRLMLTSGMRVSEVVEVSATDVQETDADYSLIDVNDSKTGSRQTLLTDTTRQQLTTVANVRGLKASESIVDNAVRTVQHWVSRACDDLSDTTGNHQWDHVSCHDLRRTWATSLIHKGIPSDIVMDWGGWQSHDTFRRHYYSLSDQQIADQLQDAGIV